MEEDKFTMLTTVLEKLENADMNQSSIKKAINEIVDDYSKIMDKDQKHKIFSERKNHERIMLDRSFQNEEIG